MGLEPDVRSFNAGICACEKGKQRQRVLALISEMWRTKFDPDATSYSLAIVALLRRRDIASEARISACETCKQSQRILSLPTETQEALLETDAISYSASIIALRDRKLGDTQAQVS